MNSNKCLCIISSMDKGGAETMLMKLFRQCSLRGIIFDFLILSKSRAAYDDEINKLGGTCYYLEDISMTRAPIKYFISIYDTIKKYKYKNILLSIDNVHMSLGLLAAKMAGAEILAIRSTNSSANKGELFDNITKKINFIARWCTNVRFAPSHLAADFLFGKDSVKKHNVHILHNGLDLNLFTFNENVRNEKRIELNLNDKFIVGHVGRLSEQKNHSFLLKVFKEICKQRNNAVLLLIGKGDLEQDILNQAYELGIADKVIFAGVCNDVNECLMAMDVMVFPSFYEGMPNVVVEAQTTGLPCIVSDTITEECQVTDMVRFMSLDNSPELWAREVIEFTSITVNRSDYAEKMRQAGYDIKDVADEFIKYIFEENID